MKETPKATTHAPTVTLTAKDGTSHHIPVSAFPDYAKTFASNRRIAETAEVSYRTSGSSICYNITFWVMKMGIAMMIAVPTCMEI